MICTHRIRPDSRISRFLVASPPARDLLFFAKHLFVAANTVWHARNCWPRQGALGPGGRAPGAGGNGGQTILLRDVSLSKNLTEAFERSSQAANARLRRLFVSARRKASVEALPLRRHIKQELCGVEALAAFCLKFAALLDELLYPHHVDVAQGAA
jgi:hypothetical protein